MSKKRQRRIAETNAELEEAVQEEAEKAKFEAADDSALFTIDSRASKRLKRKVEKEIIPEKNGTLLTVSERAIVAKLKKTMEAGEERKKYGASIVQKVGDKIDVPLKDVWGEDEVNDNQKPSRIGIRQHKVKKPLPGQSYHPPVAAHQDALAEALATEMKKIEKEQERMPIAMLKDTKAITRLLLGEGAEGADEEEEEEEDTEVGEVSGYTTLIVKKKKDKLTKAQRNRQKTRRQEETELKNKKTEEEFLHSIDKADQIAKALAEQEEKTRNAKLVRELRKTPKVETIDVNAVALSDELGGSLRTIIPKGVAVRDAVKTLIATGEANCKNRKGRKVDHAHKEKKIKWFAKYKY
ncbi:hypothetical protein EON65_08490 [archaeon]|nr:MAG: hypothetical protein EON65_08490 [archaeon]